ncbi:PEPxxWA-CTERM sorting domain-containing protein [Sphingomonas abaci]|uniref:Ice-binding protein C-terminal domain-containing protein n=1 Tax=Sphingomonas abaci TaxID=237611 RepID=A0A7W7AMU8_9SPHN|nr:PEPxxWA-CTERM sorting domain-containing protein [Sphingomonas abaci]MBB4619978.1 hypothetical protein [Sphingomonas abaci]
MRLIRYGLIACATMLAGQAQAANYIRYTATAVGNGTETTGVNPTGYDVRDIKGLQLMFTVEYNDGSGYGSVVGAGKLIDAGAGSTGFRIGTYGAPTYGFDGSAFFAFDNPGLSFPLGPILLDSGRSLINISEGYPSGLGFRFNGIATGLISTVGSAGDSFVITTYVPEPSTWALMFAGFGMVGFAMRRRRLAFA